MELDLRARLLSAAQITALVGQRVHWVRSPQGSSAPRIVLYLITSMPQMAHSGPSGLVSSRVQVDCLGLTYESAKAVARAVASCLSGYAGTSGGTRFDGCFQLSERDDFFDAETPDKLFRTSLDFNVWHKGA